MHLSRPLGGAVAAAIAAVLLTACGGTPNSAAGQQGGAGANGSAGGARLDRYMSMSNDQLVAAAKKEGRLVVYGSNSSVKKNAAAFEKRYGIKVQTYRADSEEVLQRVLQEAGAGKLPADVIDTNAGELITMNSKGVLADYSNKGIESHLRQGSVHSGWVASRYDAFVVAWNTNKVKTPPTSYEDLTKPQYKGAVELEPGDWDWYLGLYTYLTQQQGWSADKANAFFKQLAANSKVVKGHTVMTQTLDAGQFALAADDYKHLVDKDAFGKNAPVKWQPVVEPVLYRPNGIGLTKTAPHPAAAVLYMNWSLTDGQKLLPGQYRIPSNTAVTTKNPIPNDAKTFDIPLDEMTNNSAKWSQRWQQILQGVPVAGKA